MECRNVKIIATIIMIVLVISIIFSCVAFVGCKDKNENEEYIVAICQPVYNNVENLEEKLSTTAKEVEQLIKYDGFKHYKVELIENNTKIRVTLEKSRKAEIFILKINSPISFELRKEGEDKLPTSEAFVTEKDIARAVPYSNGDGDYVIQLMLNEEGTKKLAKATEENLREPINWWIGGKWIFETRVASVITNGEINLVFFPFLDKEFYPINFENYSNYEKAYSMATKLQANSLTLQLVLMELED